MSSILLQAAVWLILCLALPYTIETYSQVKTMARFSFSEMILFVVIVFMGHGIYSTGAAVIDFLAAKLRNGP